MLGEGGAEERAPHFPQSDLRRCLLYGNGISHFGDFSQGQCANVCMCQSGVYLGRVEKFMGVYVCQGG